MNLSDIMTSEVKTIDKNQRADVALRIMEENGIRHLVITHKGKPVSVISNRDLFLAAYLSMVSMDITKPNTMTVGQLATKNPIMLSPKTPILEAAQLTIDKKISAFPIVENEELLGIVTTHDMMKLFTEKLANSPEI